MDRRLDLFRNRSGRRGGGTGTSFFETLKTLEESSSVCYILDDRLRLVYCNPAWDHFAAANGGRHLTRDALIGSGLLASLPSALVSTYSQAFESVSATGRIWSKVYQCSSPDRFRTFRMRIHPLVNRGWFLVTNSLVVDRPHKNTFEPDAKAYEAKGVITMCAHCRCSRRVGAVPEAWDFVPKYLRLKGTDLLSVTHGLCPICYAYFYPET